MGKSARDATRQRGRRTAKKRHCGPGLATGPEHGVGKPRSDHRIVPTAWGGTDLARPHPHRDRGAGRQAGRARRSAICGFDSARLLPGEGRALFARALRTAGDPTVDAAVSRAGSPRPELPIRPHPAPGAPDWGCCTRASATSTTPWNTWAKATSRTWTADRAGAPRVPGHDPSAKKEDGAALQSLAELRAEVAVRLRGFARTAPASGYDCCGGEISVSDGNAWRKARA